jgi:molybdate transport system ATP-binding protein
MARGLIARFVKHYSRGVSVTADLQAPSERFFITVLFGPSGCGKSTTLRCLAGLERPDSGRITVGEATWFSAEQNVMLSPQRRGIGYLVQEYALFPHLTIAQNVEYGLTSMPRTERARRSADMLNRLQLKGLERRYPGQLSGGQQQRAALARVLARRPSLLLLDEPLSALDEPTRDQLRPELRQVLMEFDVPAILVTHERTEAMALADRLVVIGNGRMLQAGTPGEVFSRPADAAVAQIVGVETVEPGRIVHLVDGLSTVDVGGVHLVGIAPNTTGREVYVCIRGEDVVLQRDSSGFASPRNQLKCRIIALTPEGPLVRVALDCGFRLTALVTRPACDELGLDLEQPIQALIKVSGVHLVPRAVRGS